MFWLVLAALAEGGGYSAAVHTVREDCKSDLFDAFLASQVCGLWTKCAHGSSKSQ